MVREGSVWDDAAEWATAGLPTGTEPSAILGRHAACVRLLHPVGDPTGKVDGDGRQVRWSDLARWSGVDLDAGSHFWQVALPESLPPGPVPGNEDPASDVLGLHDGRVLARILRSHTGAPSRCWFGIWTGYDWVDADTAQGARGHAPFQDGHVLRLADRDYLLYQGPVEAGLTFMPEHRESADLWWPQDRSWFVYSDVDLNCTYVAGSLALIDAVHGSAEIETVSLDPSDPWGNRPGEPPDWLAHRIDRAVAELLANERAELRTSRFTVNFDLTSSGSGHACLNYQADDLRHRGGQVLLDSHHLATALRKTIIRTIADIVEG